ncbi:hypothetical protein COO60DRAFT_1165104 [Scenedesmus sp. NREL 46B-D3]|nr:hypothetical protein COO60DRAFT_1165104 [Scenedesmus sp. NREL 46B-D3]
MFPSCNIQTVIRWFSCPATIMLLTCPLFSALACVQRRVCLCAACGPRQRCCTEGIQCASCAQLCALHPACMWMAAGTYHYGQRDADCAEWLQSGCRVVAECCRVCRVHSPGPLFTFCIKSLPQ